MHLLALHHDAKCETPENTLPCSHMKFRSREQHYSENGVSDKFIICFVLQVSAPLVMYVHALQSFKRATTQAARHVH
eukprot:501810-Pelagomonas_calceolata.AAC.1